MSTLAWILLTGFAMSAIALVGSLTLLVRQETLQRAVSPLVALAAGSLLGGAFFHMMPTAVEAMGPGLAPWLWLTGGFLAFLTLERLLRWHHCHDLGCEHDATLGWLVLLALPGSQLCPLSRNCRCGVDVACGAVVAVGNR